MSRLRLHPENHFIDRIGWLRAAVLGANDGSRFPVGFNRAAGAGLGTRIIRSFVERIGGGLLFGRGDNNHGTRFTVQFS